MKFKFKIFISFIALITAGIVLTGSILYMKMNRLVLSLIQDQIRGVAETIPIFMDKDLVKEVLASNGKNRKAYDALKGMLVEATLRNRVDYNLIPFRNIFVVVPSVNENHVFILADGFGNPKDSWPYGHEFRGTPDFIANLDTSYVSPYLQEGVHGNRWYSGSSPIRDLDGVYIATLGIEVDSYVIDNQFLQTFTALLAAGMLAILIALIIAGVISHLVTRSLEIIEGGVKEIESGNYKARISLQTEDEFQHLGDTINHMVEGLTERDRLKEGFSRYVSKHVLNRVLESDRHFLVGERRRITVLFCDIRNFTTLSEKLSAEKVVGLLNKYFDKMIDVIFHNKGTLNKFMGDGMMVIFGAPLEDDKQEENAVNAAVSMVQTLKSINDEIAKDGIEAIKIGVGVHTGLAVVGNIGSDKRMEYTAIGDTVNVAARVEQLAKNYDDPIIVTEETATHLQGKYPFQNRGKVELKGRTEEIGIFSLSM